MDINPSCKPNNPGICWSQTNALSPPVDSSVLGPASDILVLAVDEFFFTDLNLLFWKDNDNYYRFFRELKINK